MAAKTIINKIANQKSGIDRPRKAKNEKALSAVVFFFAAEIIPAGTAIRRAIIKDINARESVLGRDSASIRVTG